MGIVINIRICEFECAETHYLERCCHLCGAAMETNLLESLEATLLDAIPTTQLVC